MKLNDNGFSVVEITLVVLIFAITGGVGWYVYQTKVDSDKSYRNSTEPSIKVDTNTESSQTYKELSETDVADIKTETTTSTPKATTPPAENQSTPTEPAPAPEPEGTVSISDDGCQVTANGRLG
jgi:hypothetical protein